MRSKKRNFNLCNWPSCSVRIRLSPYFILEHTRHIRNNLNHYVIEANRLIRITFPVLRPCGQRRQRQGRRKKQDSGFHVFSGVCVGYGKDSGLSDPLRVPAVNSLPHRSQFIARPLSLPIAAPPHPTPPPPCSPVPSGRPFYAPQYSASPKRSPAPAKREGSPAKPVHAQRNSH